MLAHMSLLSRSGPSPVTHSKPHGACTQGQPLHGLCTGQGCQAEGWPFTCWPRKKLSRNCVTCCTAQLHAVEQLRHGLLSSVFCSCKRYTHHCIAAVVWSVQSRLGKSCTSDKAPHWQADTACHYPRLHSNHCLLLQRTGAAPRTRQAWPGGVWVRTTIAWQSTQCPMPRAWLQPRRRQHFTRGMGGGQAMCRLTIERPPQQGTRPEQVAKRAPALGVYTPVRILQA